VRRERKGVRSGGQAPSRPRRSGNGRTRGVGANAERPPTRERVGRAGSPGPFIKSPSSSCLLYAPGPQPSLEDVPLRPNTTSRFQTTARRLAVTNAGGRKLLRGGSSLEYTKAIIELIQKVCTICLTHLDHRIRLRRGQPAGRCFALSQAIDLGDRRFP